MQKTHLPNTPFRRREGDVGGVVRAGPTTCNESKASLAISPDDKSRTKWPSSTCDGSEALGESSIGTRYRKIYFEM